MISDDGFDQAGGDPMQDYYRMVQMVQGGQGQQQQGQGNAGGLIAALLGGSKKQGSFTDSSGGEMYSGGSFGGFGGWA